CHCAAAQAEVATLLKDLKNALPAKPAKSVTASGTGAAGDPLLVPAQFTTPRATPAPKPAPPDAAPYPVPAPASAPKHLFHFIIRYEGDGIIDESVTKMMEAVNAGKTADGGK